MRFAVRRAGRWLACPPDRFPIRPLGNQYARITTSAETTRRSTHAETMWLTEHTLSRY